MVHSSLETFHFFLFVSLSIHFTIMFLGLKFLIFHALSFCNPLNLKFSVLFQLGKFLGIIAWNSSSSVKWHPTPVPLPGKIPWTEEPGRLRSMGSQSDTTEQLHFHFLCLYTFFPLQIGLLFYMYQHFCCWFHTSWLVSHFSFFKCCFFFFFW